jgi:hypothetical protein
VTDPVPPHTDPVAEAQARVSAAVDELDAVADWPPADQVAAFTSAHQALQATLAGIDGH